MTSEAERLSVPAAAERLGVSKPRVVQLLAERCTFPGSPTFELDSPQGVPSGGRHVFGREVTLASVEAYEERHPKSATGKRRERHKRRQNPEREPSDQGPRRDGDRPPYPSGLQALRLELEHQLDLHRKAMAQHRLEREEAIERFRALSHQVVDVNANLERKSVETESLRATLSSLQSAFNTYGEVFTQDIGPQDARDSGR